MIIIGQVRDPLIYEQFTEAVAAKATWKSQWSIGQGQQANIILSEDRHHFQPVSYGMIPFYGKTKSYFYEAPVNKQNVLETNSLIKKTIIRERPFQRPIRQNRCLVVCDYFILYNQQIAQIFYAQDKQPLPLAGIYDEWIDHENHQEIYKGFCLLTVQLPVLIHNLRYDRIPLILPVRRMKRWIRHPLPLLEVTRMIRPPDIELLTSYEINRTLVMAGINDRNILKPVLPLPKIKKNMDSSLSLRDNLRMHRKLKGNRS